MKSRALVVLAAIGLATLVTHPNIADAAGSNGSLYIAANLAPTFNQYDITSSGGLLPKTPATGSVGGNPLQIAATPDGRFVYMAEGQAPNGAIAEYSVAADGSLTSIGSEATGINNPWATVITPDGRFLYVSDLSSNQITEFAINAGGSLTELGTVATGIVFNLAISANGEFLYAPDVAGNSVILYGIQNDGTLTAGITMADPALDGPFDITFNPDATLAYVINDSNDTVTVFHVNGNGTFSPGVVAASASLATPDAILENTSGTHVYVANDVSGTVTDFQVNAVTGALVNGVSLSTGADPQSMAFSPDAKSLYVVNNSDDDVSLFSIDGTGALSAQTPATVATAPGGSPYGVVARPNQGPRGAFTSSGSAGSLAATFNAAASSDSGGTVERYDWNFGDGTTATNAGPTPSHQYAAAGTYTVKLTVTDNNGCSVSQVFDGKTVLCNGTLAAQVVSAVSVGVVPVPDTGATSNPWMLPTGTGLILAGAGFTNIWRRRRSNATLVGAQGGD